MKLHKTDRQIDTSGISEKGSFGIDREDMSFIARLLRDDMYSDKTLAVVREYCTNAVDAHQKAGIGETPIRIKVPTSMEPVLKIRDFGEGIAKEEIFDRYVKYGKSDKRDSDLNGYFGIGCKAGFAYGDSFIVRTFHNGTESVFSAQIGEDQLGGIFLLSEQDTTETGLEIEINIQVRDVDAFQNRIKQVCTFLAVTPILSKELDFVPYNKGKELLEGVYQIPQDYLESVSGWNSGYTSYAVMGGVRYPIDKNLAYEGVQYTDELTKQCAKLLQKGLYVEFDMAEFPLVMHPSRERLVYERTTKLNLKGRFKEVIEELGKRESADFAKPTTALEAWNVYSNAFFMKAAVWKEIIFKRLDPKVDMSKDSRRYYVDPYAKDTIKTKLFNSSTSRSYYSDSSFPLPDLLGDGDDKNAVILEKGEGQMLPRVRTLLNEGFKNVYVTGKMGLTEKNLVLKEYFPSRFLHSDDVEQTKVPRTVVTKSDGTTTKVLRSTGRHHKMDRSKRHFINQRWENSEDTTMWNAGGMWVAVAEDDLPPKDKIYVVTSRNRPVEYNSFAVNSIMGALSIINKDYDIFSVKKADEGGLDETWIEAKAYIQKHKSELQRVLTLQKQINHKIQISIASKRTLLFGNHANANDIQTSYHGEADYEYQHTSNDEYANLIGFDLKGVVDKQAEDWLGKRKVLLDTYPVLKYIDWKSYEKQETYAEMKTAILASK